MGSDTPSTSGASRDWVSVEPSKIGRSCSVAGLRNIAVVGKEVDWLLQSLKLDQAIDEAEKSFWGIDYYPRALEAYDFAEHYNMDLLVIKMHRLQEHFGAHYFDPDQVPAPTELIVNGNTDTFRLCEFELPANMPKESQWILRHFAYLAAYYGPSLQFGVRHGRGSIPQDWLIPGDGIPDDMRAIVQQTTVAPESWNMLKEDYPLKGPVKLHSKFPDMLVFAEEKPFSKAIDCPVAQGRGAADSELSDADSIASFSERSSDTHWGTEAGEDEDEGGGSSPNEVAEEVDNASVGSGADGTGDEIEDGDGNENGDPNESDDEEFGESTDADPDQPMGEDSDEYIDEDEDDEESEVEATKPTRAVDARKLLEKRLTQRMTAPQKYRLHKADHTTARCRLLSSKVAAGKVSKRQTDPQHRKSRASKRA